MDFLPSPIIALLPVGCHTAVWYPAWVGGDAMTKAEYGKFTKGIVTAPRALVARAPEGRLAWRPDESFLTLGAVVQHVCTAVGAGLRDVVDGGWAIAPGSGEGSGLPPAEAFPTVQSVKEGLDLIDADWKLFERSFARIDEATLNTQVCRIPWMAPGTTLAEYLLLTTEHLSNHRMQLFMYLRLMGVKVDTSNLYGG
jgi:hypothetical protein